MLITLLITLITSLFYWITIHFLKFLLFFKLININSKKDLKNVSLNFFTNSIFLFVNILKKNYRIVIYYKYYKNTVSDFIVF